MQSALEAWMQRQRSRRAPSLAVVLLRFLIGFAFVPAGLKKVLGQPFTDPSNRGAFHEFLHAFHATGGFYRFVGALQLTAAILLVTQRRALIGASLLLPMETAIVALCWSTGVVPTAIVATSIWLATVALVLWDFDPIAFRRRAEPSPSPVDLVPWSRVGVAMLSVYGAACVLTRGVYRPRGIELSDPRFYVFPAIMLMPLLMLVLERRRAR